MFSPPRMIKSLMRPVISTYPSASIAADCGQQFDVASLRITIRHRDDTAYDQTHALPYRIQP